MPENSAGFILWQFNVCFLACNLERLSLKCCTHLNIILGEIAVIWRSSNKNWFLCLKAYLCLIKTLVGDVQDLVEDVVDVGVLGALPLRPLLAVLHPVVPIGSRGWRGWLLALQAVTLVAVLQHFLFFSHSLVESRPLLPSLGTRLWFYLPPLTSR